MNSLTDLLKEKSSIQIDGVEEVFLFEQELAHYYEKKYCLLFNSATSALFATCIALDIKDSEIITTPFGWSGSIAPFIYFKNKIAFGSLDQNYCLDPSSVAPLIQPETKLLISIDMGGCAADSEALSKPALDNDLIYISDSAQSLGAHRSGKPAGAFADIVITSFTHGKTVNAGEGGALITDNEALYNKLVLLTQHPHRHKKIIGLEQYPFAPLNNRIHPLAAIYAYNQFQMLEQIVEKRQRLASSVISSLQKEEILESLPFEISQSTFFEFFGSPLKPFIKNYGQCNNQGWYIENNLSTYNLYEKLIAHHPHLFAKNSLPFELPHAIQLKFVW